MRSLNASALVAILLLSLFSISLISAPVVNASDDTGTNANPDNKIHYEPTWDSLARKGAAPEWFENAVLGFYFHWSAYSVPAYGSEWYPRRMYMTGVYRPLHGMEKSCHEYHVETYGSPAEFGYKDFIPMWKANKWDPDRWASLFENAGADFAGPVAVHHDGFEMWDTKYDNWNAVDRGPQTNILGRTAEAVRDHGMKLVTTFHHARNWWFYSPGRENKTYDVNDPKYSGLYTYHELGAQPPESYWENWLGRIKEVIDNYRPDQIWFDSALDWVPENYRRSFLAYYYNAAENWGKEVMVTRKQTDLPLSCSVLDIERGRAGKPKPQRWQTDTAIDYFSWGYLKEPSYKTVNTMVDRIVDRTSKNGVTLLNVAPKPDGTLPEEQIKRVNKIGDWMDVNKEALYASEPAPFVEGGVDTCQAGTLRFTRKGNYLYAIDLKEPSTPEVIPGVTPVSGSEVRMLGSDKSLDWHQEGENLVIEELPDPLPCDYAWAFKILTEPHETTKFKLSDLSVSKTELEPGESTTVSVSVRNTGGESGTYTVDLSIDGKTKTQEVTLDPDASKTVEFDVSMDEEGTYTVSAGDMTQSVVVSAPKQPESGGVPALPIIAGVIVAIAVVGAWIWRK